MDTRLTVALIAGAVALVGHAVAYFFARWRDVRLKEFEIKLKYYQNFLNSVSNYYDPQTTLEEAQRGTTKAVNLMNLMASKAVLVLIKELVDNYEAEDGYDKQWPIINRIIRDMRLDLGGAKMEPCFKFPLIFPVKARRKPSPKKQD